MIISFVGTPGSGKSYEAVKKILDNLRMGRVVVTNVEGLELPKCREAIKCFCDLSDLALARQLIRLTNEEAQEFWLHAPPGALIVIDEVHKLFNNRDWQTVKNRMMNDWASTHRHEGYDVILITQAVEKLDSQVRSLLEWSYVFRKVNFFGGAVQKKYICHAFAGEETTGKPLSKHIRHYDARVFRCYKSYVADDVKELAIMKHVNVLKHPVFFALPLVLGFSLYMIFTKSSFATGDILGAETAMKNHTAMIATNRTGGPAPGAADPAPDQEPSPSGSPGDDQPDEEHPGKPVYMFQRAGVWILTDDPSIAPDSALLIE